MPQEPDSRIQVLPMYTGDFGAIMMRLAETDTCGFDSEVLPRLFNRLISDLYQGDFPMEKDWMVNRWLDIVTEASGTRLDFDESNGDTPPRP